MHPAVAELGSGRRLVLVVAEEHAGVAGHDFADAVLVGVVDAHLGIAERDADGVEIDIVGLVDGVGAGQLGLAVELAQRHAHGQEEVEGVGAERGAAGCGGAQVGKAEPVLERAEQQPVGQPRPAAAFERVNAELHAEAEHRLLEPGRIHHLRPDIGGDRFPDARREQHEGRPDLTQIRHHRFRFFDKVDDDPADQGLGHGIDLFHDPGQRQHRNIVVARILGVASR